jgi:hypothetical protein
MNDKTPASLRPAVTSFSLFLQTSKQSIRFLVSIGPSRRRVSLQLDLTQISLCPWQLSSSNCASILSHSFRD